MCSVSSVVRLSLKIYLCLTVLIVTVTVMVKIFTRLQKRSSLRIAKKNYTLYLLHSSKKDLFRSEI